MKAPVTNERTSTARSRDLRAEPGARTAAIAVGVPEPAAAGIRVTSFIQDRAAP
jgi:hypothetical protein